jgi:hypothetical protein
MNRTKASHLTRPALAVFITLFILLNTAVAGPPLICHPFHIGNARSLPFVSHDWNLSGQEKFDTHNLANDTLEILQSSQVPLVHMETIRRATLYARKDKLVAKQLLSRLVSRAQSAETSAHSDAFAFFDAAYVIETYKQWLGEANENPAAALDGLPWMQKALTHDPNDAQMNFAAALITMHHPQKEHDLYVQQATAGAKSDSLLARNLSTHFLGEQSPTMADMISLRNEASVAKQ